MVFTMVDNTEAGISVVGGGVGSCWVGAACAFGRDLALPSAAFSSMNPSTQVRSSGRIVLPPSSSIAPRLVKAAPGGSLGTEPGLNPFIPVTGVAVDIDVPTGLRGGVRGPRMG